MSGFLYITVIFWCSNILFCCKKSYISCPLPYVFWKVPQKDLRGCFLSLGLEQVLRLKHNSQLWDGVLFSSVDKHKVCNHYKHKIKSQFNKELCSWWLRSKETTCNTGHAGQSLGWGSSPRQGNDNPLQYSCLENPRDRGAWRAI